MNPFGGYQVNRHGERFVESDYWSGQMMAEFAAELASDRGPVYLKVSHLPEETVAAVESILHTTERPTRGTFHQGRGHDYRTHDIEMHISEIGLCGGHSASGVRVDAQARTTVPRLYAAGDLACVPHNYMIGAFVYGDLAGEDAARYRAYRASCPGSSSPPPTSSSTGRCATRTGRRSRRWSTSCGGSSTTTWRRRSRGRSCPWRWRRSRGCPGRSPGWGRGPRTS